MLSLLILLPLLGNLLQGMAQPFGRKLLNARLQAVEVRFLRGVYRDNVGRLEGFGADEALVLLNLEYDRLRERVAAGNEVDRAAPRPQLLPADGANPRLRPRVPVALLAVGRRGAAAA